MDGGSLNQGFEESESRLDPARGEAAGIFGTGEFSHKSTKSTCYDGRKFGRSHGVFEIVDGCKLQMRKESTGSRRTSLCMKVEAVH